MAHIDRQMTPLYLLKDEKQKLDNLAEKKGISRQKILEEIISSSINTSKQEARSERRQKNKRLKTKLQVYFGPTKKTILSGFSVDISAGGLFLQTDYPFQENDEMRLIFTLPNLNKSISCDAKVAWTNVEEQLRQGIPNGVGLEFVHLSLQDLISISKFIEDQEIEGVW